MGLLITGLIVFASIVMILVVLVQKSKGGGLASGFSSANQIMGAAKTSDNVEKLTWALAISIIVLSIGSVAFLDTKSINAGGSQVLESIKLNEKAMPATPNAGLQNNATPAAAEGEVPAPAPAQ